MINLCLVVIATQFSETKKREMERMRQERARYQSTSTLASMSTSDTSCYRQIIRYIAHLFRRYKRRWLRRYRAYRSRKRQELRLKLKKRERKSNRDKRHLPHCSKFNKNSTSVHDLGVTANTTSIVALRISEASSSPEPQPTVRGTALSDPCHRSNPSLIQSIQPIDSSMHKQKHILYIYTVAS